MAAVDLLVQRERQLNLLMALDSARDAVEVKTDPASMFGAIVHLLKEYFASDACAILLLQDDEATPDNLTVNGTDEDMALKLCRQAMSKVEPGALNSEVWPHTLGLQIIEGDDRDLLGGFFLARTEKPYTAEDIALLKVAETQIDSAVIQARVLWNLANRNRELEAIYQIDRLSDNTADESELIAGFSTVLTDYFQADLCMVMLTHVDSGDLILRGMMDRENLPIAALDAIRSMTGELVIPQVIETPPEITQLHLLAAPLIVSGTRLGAVVVGSKKLFTTADHRLLYAMTSQMDTAVAHSRVYQQLQQRNRELEAIYRIDHIRDSDVDFDMMMVSVLRELCKAVSSELGYLMLYSESEERQLELKATTTEGLLTSPIYYQTINRVSRMALEKGEPVYSNKLDGAVRSIVAVPLILNQKIIGVFGAVNSTNPRGFSIEDHRMLTAITSQVDTAVFERLERRRMRRVLSRSVDPKVLDRLLQVADDNLLTGERVVISVIFADLRGSTEWAERTEPEILVGTLNAFLGRMADVIFKHGGTLDKFVGDEVIALFGTPITMKDHTIEAARCALEMQNVHAQLQAALQAIGLELPPMGIGISAGEVIAGEFGTPIRTDFTAMGRVMNLGARLCGVAEPGQILIDPVALSMLAEHVEAEKLSEPFNLKGLGMVNVYKLLKLKE